MLVRMTLRHDPAKGVGRPDEAAGCDSASRWASRRPFDLVRERLVLAMHPPPQQPARAAGSPPGRGRGHGHPGGDAGPRATDGPRVTKSLAAWFRSLAFDTAPTSVVDAGGIRPTLPVRARETCWRVSLSPLRSPRGRHRSSEDPCTQSSRPAGSSTASRSAPSSRLSCSTSSPARRSRSSACSWSPTALKLPSALLSSPMRPLRRRSSAAIAARRSSPSSTARRPAAASRRVTARS